MKYKDEFENIPVNLGLLLHNTQGVNKGGKKPVNSNCF